MQSQKQVWKKFQQFKSVSFVVKAHLVVVLMLLFVGIFSLGAHVKAAHVQSNVAYNTQQTQHATRPNVTNMPSTGSYNSFPYPSCTWWADQRYRQLHGVYVPWSTNSNAWQWTTRAYQFGWHVSSRASWGAIVDLQPWVQGAYGYGHVAVVEQVYSDGSVLASNMSWGSNPYRVVYVHLYPGSGVTFTQW